MVWAAYTKLTYKGKPEGRAFRGATGRTRAEAIKLNMKSNAQWNKWANKKYYKAVHVSVKKVKK
jgi:hypothetical protein